MVFKYPSQSQRFLLSIHQESLGLHPPLDDELDEPEEDEPELDELLPELPGPPGGGLTGSGELPGPNSLPRHSPVSVTKQTLATKVEACSDCVGVGFNRGRGTAERCVCEKTKIILVNSVFLKKVKIVAGYVTFASLWL